MTSPRSWNPSHWNPNGEPPPTPIPCRKDGAETAQERQCRDLHDVRAMGKAVAEMWDQEVSGAALAKFASESPRWRHWTASAKRVTLTIEVSHGRRHLPPPVPRINGRREFGSRRPSILQAVSAVAVRYRQACNSLEVASADGDGLFDHLADADLHFFRARLGTRTV